MPLSDSDIDSLELSYPELCFSPEKRMLCAQAREANALREQVAFLERFADPPDMKTGKTTRDALRERLAAAMAEIKELNQMGFTHQNAESLVRDMKDAEILRMIEAVAPQTVATWRETLAREVQRG